MQKSDAKPESLLVSKPGISKKNPIIPTINIITTITIIIIIPTTPSAPNPFKLFIKRAKSFPFFTAPAAAFPALLILSAPEVCLVSVTSFKFSLSAKISPPLLCSWEVYS